LKRLKVKRNPNRKCQWPCFKKEKVKRKTQYFFFANLKDITYLPAAMGGDAGGISAWCDTCMGPAAYLDGPRFSESAQGALGEAGSWCSCLGGRIKQHFRGTL